jgi:hypothetical protein
MADRRTAGWRMRAIAGSSGVKFRETRPFATPEAAMAKLLEIANGIEADHAGRISVGAVNHAFLDAGGNAGEYGAAMHRAVADGWLEMHPSGSYVILTRKG